jgi:uncharacterized cofD-like protein
MKKIVTIGGGTGQFTLLSGLKKIPDFSITAIISMADSGGSSGRLRDELGALPPGDVLRALLALSDLPSNAAREILLHRFSEGNLKNHNAGNMLLTMLSSYSGSFLEAVRALGEVLQIKGKVLPVTTGNITLKAELEDGTVIVGETNIDVPKHNPNLKIKRVWLEPNSLALSDVLKSIKEADNVIIGPGDLYTSIVPALLVKGVKEALADSTAQKIFICNTMTKQGETHGFKVSDFVKTIENYLELTLDCVICNIVAPPAEITARYGHEKAEPVNVDVPENWESRKIIKADILSSGELARHDAEKLAKILMKLS